MAKLSLFFVAMCMMLSAAVAQTSTWDGTHTSWTNGTGTQTNPYLIENAQQLAHLAYYVNNSGTSSDQYWLLTTNIDLANRQWTPIGNGDFFLGHFDGNRHTITNLFVNVSNYVGLGLFGGIDNGTIKNIGIVGGSNSITAFNCIAGGIAAMAYGSNIINCNYSGYVSSSFSFSFSDSPTAIAGGIVGNASGCNVDSCYNEGIVIASSKSNTIPPLSYAGGIVGRSYYSTNINNCYNIGNISSNSTSSGNYVIPSYAGGIVGGSNSPYTQNINNCYNIGDISSSINATSGNAYAGGIFGGSTGYVFINNCYNTGGISGSKKGPIASIGPVSNCYFLNNYIGIPENGIPQTEAFMKTQGFVDLLNNGPAANFAYLLDISLINDGYPILEWQKLNADAALSSLTVSEGTLTPAFSSDVYNYTVDVAYSVNSIMITATANDENATVVGAGEKQPDVDSIRFP